MALPILQYQEFTIISDNARSHATFPLHHASETDVTAATRARKPTKMISRWSSDATIHSDKDKVIDLLERSRKIPNNEVEPPARWQREPRELLNNTTSSATHKSAAKTASGSSKSRWNIGSELVAPAINRPLDMMAMRKPPRRQPSLRRIDSDDGLVQHV